MKNEEEIIMHDESNYKVSELIGKYSDGKTHAFLNKDNEGTANSKYADSEETETLRHSFCENLTLGTIFFFLTALFFVFKLIDLAFKLLYNVIIGG